jgi:hypothetical protein
VDLFLLDEVLTVQGKGKGKAIPAMPGTAMSFPEFCISQI